MRHLNAGRKLGRTSSHRKLMFRNMVCSLFSEGVIITTLAKAKELRRIAEPFITLAKVGPDQKTEDILALKRLAFNRLRNRFVVVKLFAELGPCYLTRPGGYLRILKCGFRAGDRAPLARVELV